MKRLKDVLFCAFTFALFLCLIVALDVVTGVPLSYGVPLAALLALAPYAFVLARALTARQPRRATTRAAVGAAAGRREGREGVAADLRPCSIHSVFFVVPESGRAGGGHAATPPAAA
jgi:hypothetical protein